MEVSKAAPLTRKVSKGFLPTWSVRKEKRPISDHVEIITPSMIQTDGARENSSAQQSPPCSPTQSHKSKSLRRLGSKEKMKFENATFASPEVELLINFMKDRKRRNLLVLELISERSNNSIKVRFCSAVAEFESVKDKFEKRAKGRKIVSMFIQNGSMFQLQGVPYQAEQSLITGKNFDELTAIKLLMIHDLAKCPTVLKLISTQEY